MLIKLLGTQDTDIFRQIRLEALHTEQHIMQAARKIGKSLPKINGTRT